MDLDDPTMTLFRMSCLVDTLAPNIAGTVRQLLSLLQAEIDVTSNDAFVICYTTTTPPSSLPWVETAAAAAEEKPKAQNKRSFLPPFGFSS